MRHPGTSESIKAITPSIAAFLLLAALYVVVSRSSGIRQLTLWVDEALVVFRINGIGWSDRWPATFTRAEVIRPDDMGSVLRAAAHSDPYPAFIYCTLSILGMIGNPVLLGRILGLLCALAATGLGFHYLRSQRSSFAGVLFVLFACLSGHLVLESQELKHTAFTPFFGLVSTYFFEQMGREAQPRFRVIVGYSIASGLGLITHYTFAALVVAHAVCLLFVPQVNRRSWLLALAASLPIWLPWYAFAAWQQGVFAIRWYLSNAPRLGGDTGFTHRVDLGFWTRDLFFIAQTLAGLRLGPVGSMRRFIALFGAFWIPLSLLLRRENGRPVPVLVTFVFLGITTPVLTLVQFATGHAGALQPHYFLPVAYIALIGGALGISRLDRKARVACSSTVLASLVVGNMIVGFEHKGAHQVGAITMTASLGRLLEAKAKAGDTLCFPTAFHAKQANVFYRGAAQQLILEDIVAGDETSTPTGQVIAVTDRLQELRLPQAWNLVVREREQLGNVEVQLLSSPEQADGGA